MMATSPTPERGRNSLSGAIVLAVAAMLLGCAPEPTTPEPPPTEATEPFRMAAMTPTQPAGSVGESAVTPTIVYRSVRGGDRRVVFASVGGGATGEAFGLPLQTP